MAVLAHPDDESLGIGGTLARYASEGVHTCVVTATRGERGRFGDGEPHPGPEALGRIREAELRAAARELGVAEVHFLDYIDGDLDRADPVEATAKIVAHLRRVRPQVVITFDPFGGYGHPDHIAICQLTHAAVIAAADPAYDPGDHPAHRISKLYCMAATPELWEVYQRTFKKLVVQVDGVERGGVPWPEWSVTSVIETDRWWPVVWKAVQSHRSQMAIYRHLGELSAERQQVLAGAQRFYRVMSFVNGGRRRESCLFEGIP